MSTERNRCRERSRQWHRRASFAGGGGLGGLLLIIAFFASPALAAPVHPPLGDPIGGFALNRACGTAADPEGDIYVSSAGNSKVEVFGPSGNHLASIPNGNEPCSLAVDSRGTVYVSEKATGKVVKYVPDAFPLSVSPSYGSAVPVDSSGEAKGIGVDLEDDRLYVAEGDHAMVYQRDGTSGQDEVQEAIIIGAVTGGTFTLEFEGQSTTGIPYNATPKQVQSALEALPTILAGNVEVEEGRYGAYSRRITFTHALGSKDVAPLSANSSGLTGGSVTTEISVQGFAFNGIIGEGELSQATAIAPYTYDRGGNTRRYLFVADSDGDTVKVLSGAAVTTLKETSAIDGKGVPDSPGCPTCSSGFGFGASGAALAADQANGHVLVYDNAHKVLDEFEARGQYLDQVNLTEADPGFEDAGPSGVATRAQSSELQRLAVSASAGSFTLAFAGQTTGPLAFNASATQVQSALEALSTIGVGNVAVEAEGSSGPYRILFSGGLANRNVARILTDGSGLSGGASVVGLEVLRQGSGPGRLYISSGPGPGAKLLAFGPLPAPSRKPLPDLSHALEKAEAVATDSTGDVYVSAGAFIHVYDPSGKELLRVEGEKKAPLIEDPEVAYDLDVDSTGTIYVLEANGSNEEKVTYYTPSSYPPTSSTTYIRRGSPCTTNVDFPISGRSLRGLGVNPENDHLFVVSNAYIHELSPAASGCSTLDSDFASGFNLATRLDIAVDGSNGQVYIASNPGVIFVLDPSGKQILAQISGAGSPYNSLGTDPAIAVDQSNGDVVAFDHLNGAAQEYEASGAFVAKFGEFSKEVSNFSRVAIDNSATSPNRGNAYVAFDGPTEPSDLTAFGPLAYGEPPIAETNTPTGLGGGGATLKGTVDPRGVELTDCHFEYATETYVGEHGFAAAPRAPCVPALGGIGSGFGAVPVHADISGLDAEKRYSYRLVIANEYGPGLGKAVLFGAPIVATKGADPVSYTEATLHATIDPSGLPTSYHFQFGTSEAYNERTQVGQLNGKQQGATEVQIPATGLAEGTLYHFRVVAENEAGEAHPQGLDQTFVTRRNHAPPSCENAEYRTGRSVNLADCRAYELVTPADTGGASPAAAVDGGSGGRGFNNWLTLPHGEKAGDRVSYFADGTLPGYDGNGRLDGYRAVRGGGAHPIDGWTNELFAPTYEQAGGSRPRQHGVSSDQRYSIWEVEPREVFAGTLQAGAYLRTPEGFEPLVAADQEAESFYVSSDGDHVIFGSKEDLVSAAPPKGTEALYDRSADSDVPQIVSLLPGNLTPPEDASYVSASEDGSAVAFRVGGALYLRRGGQTTEVAAAPNAFAGISEDGGRVFFADQSNGKNPAGLFYCDVSGGSCAGPNATHTPISIAANSIFVNVSADGSHAFFTSKDALTGEENENGEVAKSGESNLYAFDGATHFIGILDSRDLTSFEGNPAMSLASWSSSITAGPDIGIGNAPARSTPDGGTFVFLSHAQLSNYDNEGKAEVYRYDSDSTAPLGQGLLCVSCDSVGTPPGEGATLQSLLSGVTTPVQQTTLIPNLTADGAKIFFQSEERLVPEDANEVQDVYEWQAVGVGGCEEGHGCLALVSSGQGERDSFLYAMSANGSDVFFVTQEKLVGADVVGSPSIYDAREGGGIPDPPQPAPCQGDSCQGTGSTPPSLPTPASSGSGEGNAPLTKKGCPKGKHRVVSRGASRCVSRHRKVKRRVHHHRRHRASHQRGGNR